MGLGLGIRLELGIRLRFANANPGPHANANLPVSKHRRGPVAPMAAVGAAARRCEAERG